MRLDAIRTVFVDVDTQVDFIEPHGALYVPGAELLKPSFAALMAAAHAKAVPIIASADAHEEGDPEFTIFPPHCIAGTPGQLRIAETMPVRSLIVDRDGNPRTTSSSSEHARAATVVLEKVQFDLFTNPGAGRVLSETGAEIAVVFGVALDYCVRAAALGLCTRGYETLVVRDATAAVTVESGARAEEELRAAGVRFVRTEEILAAIA